MSPEEEDGYYYGFANEGLWPLCHLAHVRPVFRSSDWEQYKKINERFALAIIEEAKPTTPSCSCRISIWPWCQDRARPSAARDDRDILAHPWSDPERYAICPWYREILEGLLGSSILGFHTTIPLQNFINTVDRLSKRGSTGTAP